MDDTQEDNAREVREISEYHIKKDTLDELRELNKSLRAVSGELKSLREVLERRNDEGTNDRA